MINNILKKIEKANEVESSKVELAKHEVDLALTDDVKNTLKAAADFYKGILKANDTIKKNIASINQSLKASKVDINPKWGTGTLGIAKKYQAQMDKTAKELGVSLKGSELDKQISELYNLAESGQGLIDDLNAALRTIGKS
jgi:hypothetical protein